MLTMRLGHVNRINMLEVYSLYMFRMTRVFFYKASFRDYRNFELSPMIKETDINPVFSFLPLHSGHQVASCFKNTRCITSQSLGTR